MTRTIACALLLIALAAIGPFGGPRALADGGSSSGTRGGGDETGIDALALLHSAIEDLRMSGLASSLGLDLQAIQVQSDGARWVMVDRPLVVSSPAKGNISQISVAVNDPVEKLVEINRARWNAIPDVRVKKATLLHEALSLLRLESTGRYPISSRYLALTGYVCARDLCNNTALAPSISAGVPFAEASALFREEGRVPSIEALAGGWKLLGESWRPETFVPKRVHNLFESFDAFDPKGLRDANGRLIHSIIIERHQSPFGKRVWMVSMPEAPAVTPLQLSPGGVSFNKAEYISEEETEDAAWAQAHHPGVDLDCRLIRDGAYLLCAAVPRKGAYASRARARFAGHVTRYSLYSRL